MNHCYTEARNSDKEKDNKKTYLINYNVNNIVIKYQEYPADDFIEIPIGNHSNNKYTMYPWSLHANLFNGGGGSAPLLWTYGGPTEKKDKNSVNS